MLVLQEMKEVDSTRKYVTEVQYNAPPLIDDEIYLNKQFKTQRLESERVCLEFYGFAGKVSVK